MTDLLGLGWLLVAVYAVDRAYRVAMPVATAIAARVSPPPAFTPSTATKPEDEPIPEDLIAWAGTFKTDWARDEAMTTLRERYLEHKDWNMVRRSVGLAAA